jgi:hypothetical protein
LRLRCVVPESLDRSPAVERRTAHQFRHEPAHCEEWVEEPRVTIPVFVVAAVVETPDLAAVLAFTV